MQHVSAGHNGLQLNLSGTNAGVRQTDMQRKKQTNDNLRICQNI